MTYCNTLSKPLKRLINEKKSLEEIGVTLCGDSVKNPRNKAKRLIREILGQEVLDQNAETLGYQISKLRVSGKQKSYLRKKISAEEDRVSDRLQGQCTEVCEHDKTNHVDRTPTGDNELSHIVEAVSVLISRHGKDLFMEALATLKIIVPFAKVSSVDKIGVESIEQKAYNPLEASPVDFSVDSAYERIIIEHIKAHPNIRIFDIFNDSKIRSIAIIMVIGSMLKRGIIKQTDSGLYIAATHDTPQPLLKR
jgi:hypothetical protein